MFHVVRKIKYIKLRIYLIFSKLWIPGYGKLISKTPLKFIFCTFIWKVQNLAKLGIWSALINQACNRNSYVDELEELLISLKRAQIIVYIIENLNSLITPLPLALFFGTIVPDFFILCTVSQKKYHNLFEQKSLSDLHFVTFKLKYLISHRGG